MSGSPPASVRSLVKARRGEGFTLRELSAPKVGPNKLLIRINKAATCGTDVHSYNGDEWSQWTIPVPTTVGHEFVGVISAFGEAVRGLEIGDRVSGEGHVTCGVCRNCRARKRHLRVHTVAVGVNRPDAFADYLVSQSNLLRRASR